MQRRPERSVIMVGLRGVGKTVLLSRLQEMAEGHGAKTISVEAHEGATLPDLLFPPLRTLLFELSILEVSKEKARRGIRALKGFMSGIKLKSGMLDLELSVDAEPGLADSGHLQADLPDLIITVAEAARAADRSIVIFIDELQYLTPEEFGALIMCAHRMNQKRLPFLLIGAGLPQVLALAGNSKSYAERLFRFPEIGALDRVDATRAIVLPAENEGIRISRPAIDRILDVTERYPYFLSNGAMRLGIAAATT